MLGTKKKKGSISEEDTSLLLQRYSATTILSLLQEVSQLASVKIDWKALVQKSSTGISSAREYQMLWRHLAYRDSLLEKVEDGAEPLDDDSDLEFEVEAVPAVSSEASSEASACVKVLISSCTSNDHGQSNRSTLEAPLMINIPNGQVSSVASDEQQQPHTNRGMNIAVPVSIQKQPQPPGSSTEVLDGNVSAGPPKKKRKPWTKEEDMELIAAVQKYGEGNWATILKGDFKHDRTASQLSQRWSTIRRRQTNLTAGSVNNPSGGNQSEAVLATRNAVSMALNMPSFGSLSALCSGATQSSIPSGPAATPSVPPESAPVSAPQAVNQPQPAANQVTVTSQKASSASSTRSRATKKSSAPGKPAVGMPKNSMIQAAAFAAGGRIATPSTAASLFRAALSKNAVHFRPGATALPKSSVKSTKPSSATNTTGSQPVSLHSSKLAVMPPPPSGPRVPGQQTQESSGKVTTQTPPTNCATTTDASAQQLATEPNSAGVSNCASAPERTMKKNGNEIPMTNVVDLDEAATQDHQSTLAAGDIDSRKCTEAENNQAPVDMQVDTLNSEAGNKAEPVDTKPEISENQTKVKDSNLSCSKTDMDIDATVNPHSDCVIVTDNKTKEINDQNKQ
ncbi:Myb domain-containing protein [Dioscorea alata]|uniref:Myb domain-containing protein n=1 Tax=Dioscorea alata TaxID=55571 RepID=A0ACB7WBI3_DIOAL|nr:Myb domain-containing protein [Dioscorea alata]